MITKLAKCAALLISVASANEVAEIKKEETPIVSAGSAVDWFLFSLGLSLGAGLETGTNIGGLEA
jgi:hypothetical protein